MCKINPRIDFAFKKLFGSEENKDLLKSLVNSILSDDQQIVELELKNPYNFADYADDKFSIVDIKAKDNAGRWFNVEMQMNYYPDFDKTALYYWAKIFTDQIEKGKEITELKKTISINILDFEYLKGDAYHKIFEILEIESKLTNIKSDKRKSYTELEGGTKVLRNKTATFHDLFEMHFIELRRFTKDYPEIVTTLDRWITFLNRAHEIEKNNIPKELKSDDKIVKAINAVDIMFDKAERKKYEIRMKHKQISDVKLKSMWNDGKEEGIVVGIEKGMEKEKIEIAKKLKLKSMTTAEIIELTGLTKDQIDSL